MTEPNVVVRLARESDLETLASFNIHAAQETDGITLPAGLAHQGAAGVLQDSKNGTYYVLEEDGEVAAMLLVALEYDEWVAQPWWWVHSVYVSPEHRRKGHYRRMYLHVRDLAKDSGAAGMRLFTHNTNMRAQQAYEKLGMQSTAKLFEDMFGSF